MHNALQSVSVPGGGPSVPHSDGGGEDGPDGCVELHHHLSQRCISGRLEQDQQKARKRIDASQKQKTGAFDNLLG